MGHKLNSILIIGLAIHGSCLLGQAPEMDDSYPSDNIWEPPFDPIKVDVEDPAELLWAAVETIIQELDKMTLMPDEIVKPDTTFTDHVSQMTGTASLDHDADLLNHSIDRILDGHPPDPTSDDT